MKNTLLVCACIALAGCSSGAQVVGNDVLRAMKPNQDKAWTHTILVTNPGTRSEGLREDLAYAGQAVPASIERLVALGYDWEYRPFANAWTPWGWHVAGPAPALDMAGAPLSEKELAEGMAPTEGLSMRPDTPSRWVLAIRGDEHWCCDPELLSALATSRGWTAPR